MARASLSREQLCFAILIESHAAVCEIFFSIVVDAMKATDPENWKEAVSSSFGHGVGQHVKQRLDDGLVETDFYAVCKVLRSRLREVAKLCGGKIIDLHERERLSLQIQGVETARHWLFHGEQYLSPRELCSSLALLATILTSLSCYPNTSFVVLQRLSSLRSHAEELVTLSPHSEYPICSTAVLSAVLHSALIELKRNFTAFSRQRKLNTDNIRKQKTAACAKADVMAGDYPTLFREIRRASSQLSKKDKLRVISGYDQPISVIDLCKNVSDLRNASAHGRRLTLSETKSGVCQICEILAAFRLNNEQTTLLQKKLEDLQDDESDGIYLCCFERKEDSGQANSVDHLKCKRIFRSTGQHFVGRKDEVTSMISYLQDDRCEATTKRAVLVFGSPGIGKSHLAAHVADSLSHTYKIQSWLSCSTPSYFEQDLIFSCDFKTTIERVATGPKSTLQNSSNTFIPGNIGCANFHRLIVFDDVCVSTIELVHKLLANFSFSAIITTKSTIVRLFFQARLCSLHVVHPQVFLLEESQELVAEKANMSGFDRLTMASIDKVLCGVLGNLPLAVNVYSSLLAVSLKRPEKMMFDVFDERLVIENWEDIEERFGDRFHVRGFTGLVQSAKKYLRKFPLAMFLMAKICLADNEIVPWNVLQTSKRHNKPEAPQENRWIIPHDCSLFGVTDWLFSNTGRKTLELCRYELEELSLVSWEESTSTVHIHRLTLRSAQKLLEANHHFMGDLVILLIQRERARNELENCTSVETVSFWLSVELLQQIVHKCVEILSKATHDSQSICLNDLQRSFPVFAIAERLFAGSMRSSTRKFFKMLGALRSDLIMISIGYARVFNLSTSIHLSPQIAFINTPNLREEENRSCCYNYLTAFDYIKIRKFRNAWESLEKVMKRAETLFGEQSLQVAKNHCDIAICVEQEAGTLARKTYLQEASRRCPHLMTLPKAEDIREELSALSNFRNGSAENHLRTIVWSTVLNFQIADEMKETGSVSSATFEVAHLLIKFYQQKQQLVLEHVHKLLNSPLRSHSKRWRAGQLIRWILAVVEESKLWLKMTYCGYFLRMVSNQVPVIEEDLLTGLVQSIFLSERDQRYSDYCKWLVLHCIHSSSFVGHFALAEKLCSKLVASLSNTQTSPQKSMSLKAAEREKKTPTSLNDGTAYVNEHVAWINCSFRLAQQIRLLHENMDFEGAVDCFLKLVEETYRRRHGSCTDLGRIALNYVVCLSCLLGSNVGLRALITIRGWAEDTRTCSSSKLAFQMAAKEINRQLEKSELSAMCSDFLESRKSLEANDQLSTRRFSLRCWKAIVQLVLDPVDKSWQRQYEFACLLLSILLELVSNLEKCYSADGNVQIVEWFLSFGFHSARRAKCYFLAAIHGMECAEYLQTTGRQAEAVEQCRLVENILVEHFGDDYAEWLPNAPHTNMIA